MVSGGRRSRRPSFRDFRCRDWISAAKGRAPFHFRIGDNGIEEDSCQGTLQVDGHAITWNLRYRSTFRVTLSNKGWIGFSRTPHSDALFSGTDHARWPDLRGRPLGFGVQGHNCGYRHRNFWTWTHAYFPRPGQARDHVGSIGLRDAVRTGLSQSGAVARWTEARLPEHAGDWATSGQYAVEVSLCRAKWIAAGGRDRRTRPEPASSSLSKD